MDESAIKRGILSDYPDQRGYAESQAYPLEKPDARAVPRKNLFLAATLLHGSARFPVKVRNLSERGAMVEAAILPQVGNRVSLIRGSLAVDGTVVWSREKYCGLALATSISVAGWTAPPANGEQHRVDQNIAMVRAGITSASTGAMTPAVAASRISQSASRQLVEHLSMTVHLLDDLGDDLIADPATIAAHGAKLQNIDLASQVLAAIVAVMTAQTAGEPFSLAHLSDLRVSCGEALGGASKDRK